MQTMSQLFNGQTVYCYYPCPDTNVNIRYLRHFRNPDEPQWAVIISTIHDKPVLVPYKVALAVKKIVPEPDTIVTISRQSENLTQDQWSVRALIQENEYVFRPTPWQIIEKPFSNC